MDPITTAIVVAVSAGAAAGTTEVGKKAIVDAYNGLKNLIIKKFGNNSPVIKAVNNLEAEQDSKGLQKVLNEKVTAMQADKDSELIESAQRILNIVQSKQASVSKFTVQADNIQGLVQADNIDNLNQTFNK
jgi:hypothetical protein